VLPAAKLGILVVTASLLTGGALVVFTGGADGSDHGLDTDGDGLYDWLVVEMPLAADAANYYNVYAILGTRTPFGGGCLGGGMPGPLPLGPPVPILGGNPGIAYPETNPDVVYPISWAMVRAFYEKGDHTVSLAFRGTDIGYAGVDGPYEVRAIVFPDGQWGDPRMGGPGILPMPTFRPWSYTTQGYDASAFEQPRFAIRFTGTYEDRGVDENGNGRYDYLVVEAPADVNLAGPYTFGATLTAAMDGNWTYNDYPTYWISSTYGTVDLAEGRQTVEVRFNGGDIWASGVSGAMDFAIFISYDMGYGYGGDGRNGTVPPPLLPDFTLPTGFDAYGDALCGATSEYRHEQWDELVEPAEFTGAFADRGEDYDADGLYDALAVDVGVNVTAPSRFEFSGQLMSGDGGTFISSDWQDLYLNPGEQTLTLRFSGPAIAASGVDGPYRVDISLVARRDPQTTYTTGPYAHTDFDADGNNTRGMIWIADLSADASEIRTTVERGLDLLTVVMEGTVHVQTWAADGTLAFEGNGTVSLSSGGDKATLTFAWSPAPGTYVVAATLTSQWGNDAARITVTV